MKPTIAQIIAAVAEAFQIRPDDITGPRRFSYITRPRFAVYAIAHDAGYSYPVIAGRLGKDDHTTIMDGAKRVPIIAAKDPDYARKYEDLRERLVGYLINYRNWKFKSIRSAQ
jgi:chromosomal replication initiation ATPase DnaA